MKFTINSVKERTIQSINKVLKECSLTDETGKRYEKVTLWNSDWSSIWNDIKEGFQVTGDIKETEKNGYKNVTLYPQKTSSGFPQKANNIAKAQEKKAEDIKVAQDRKQTSMEELASFRDATLLTVAYFGNRKDLMSTDEIQAVWKSWRSWLKDRLNEPF